MNTPLKRQRSDSIAAARAELATRAPKKPRKYKNAIPIKAFDYVDPPSPRSPRPQTPLPIEKNKYTEDDWLMLTATQREDDSVVSAAMQLKEISNVSTACKFLMEAEKNNLKST